MYGVEEGEEESFAAPFEDPFESFNRPPPPPPPLLLLLPTPPPATELFRLLYILLFADGGVMLGASEAVFRNSELCDVGVDTFPKPRMGGPPRSEEG